MTIMTIMTRRCTLYVGGVHYTESFKVKKCVKSFEVKVTMCVWGGTYLMNGGSRPDERKPTLQGFMYCPVLSQKVIVVQSTNQPLRLLQRLCELV